MDFPPSSRSGCTAVAYRSQKFSTGRENKYLLPSAGGHITIAQAGHLFLSPSSFVMVSVIPHWQKQDAALRRMRRDRYLHSEERVVR